MNAQKRMFFNPFLYKTEQCERVASMQQKRILTKVKVKVKLRFSAPSAGIAEIE